MRWRGEDVGVGASRIGVRDVDDVYEDSKVVSISVKPLTNTYLTLVGETTFEGSDTARFKL
jgi:hypothetical protein